MSYRRVFKIFLILLAFSFLISNFSFLNIVSAQTYSWRQAIKDLASDSPIKNLDQIYGILAKIVRVVYTVFFIVALLFLLLAAYNFLFARGDATKVKNARTEILWAIVAIAIAMISLGAAQIIETFISSP